MALPDNHSLDEVIVWAYMADVSTAGSAFAVAPVRGTIVKMGSTLYSAITGADAIITSKIAGTAITGGGWTIANASSAGGDVDSAVPTAARFVTEDQYIEFISDGASSTAAPAMFYAVIRKE